jgi:hypothetical protein
MIPAHSLGRHWYTGDDSLSRWPPWKAENVMWVVLAGNVGDMSVTWQNAAYFCPDRPISLT